MDRMDFLKSWAKRCIPVLLTIAIVTLIFLLGNGMPLWGAPSAEDVERAEVSYPAVTDEIKEPAGERLKTAVNLIGCLKYDLFRGAEEGDEPLITIAYYTKDGKEATVSASRKTVWWNGKAYALKEEDLFVNLAEGLFFLEDLAEKQDSLETADEIGESDKGPKTY